MAQHIGQAIDARSALGVAVDIARGGRESGGGPGSADELAAKFVRVEKAVNISAEDPAGCADGAVGECSGQSFALDFAQRRRAALVKRLADVNLVARERNLARAAKAEEIAM